MLLFRRFATTAARQNILVFNEASWPSEYLSQAKASCSVHQNFISDEEEQSLLTEIEPHMKRLKVFLMFTANQQCVQYEKHHWDDAIYLYREREQRKWSPQNMATIERITDKSFTDETLRKSSYIHILDLHADGHIKPHIDATRYCGRIVTGVSLLSDSIMRLKHKDNKDSWIIDLLLPRRSLYKIRFGFKTLHSISI